MELAGHSAGNCAQITCEKMSTDGKDEKTTSTKSIMGKRLWTCPISEQNRIPPAFFRSFCWMDM
jgi:hypothetical protein